MVNAQENSSWQKKYGEDLEALHQQEQALLEAVQLARLAYETQFIDRLLDSLAKMTPDRFTQIARVVLRSFGFTQIEQLDLDLLRGIGDCQGYPLIHPHTAFWMRRGTDPLTVAEVHGFRGWINTQQSPFGIVVTLSEVEDTATAVAHNPKAAGIVLVDRTQFAKTLIEKRIGVEVCAKNGITVYQVGRLEIGDRFYFAGELEEPIRIGCKPEDNEQLTWQRIPELSPEMSRLWAIKLK